MKRKDNLPEGYDWRKSNQKSENVDISRPPKAIQSSESERQHTCYSKQDPRYSFDQKATETSTYLLLMNQQSKPVFGLFVFMSLSYLASSEQQVQSVLYWYQIPKPGQGAWLICQSIMSSHCTLSLSRWCGPARKSFHCVSVLPSLSSHLVIQRSQQYTLFRMN